MLKNKSEFSRSNGDEAGTLKGIASNKNMAKAKFALYSFDVKVEGKNVPRLGDPMTTNGNNPNSGHPGEVQPTIAVQGIDPPECDELEMMLEATLNEELPPSKTKGATVVVGTVIGSPRRSSVVGGASSISKNTIERGGKYGHWAKGVQKGEKSNVKTCDGDSFEYKQTGRPKEGHAEAKIIEDFFKQGGKGKLIIKIGGAKSKPCPDCQRLINEVNRGKDGKKCDVITVCQ